MTIASFSLADRYQREAGTVYLSGVQALVRTLLDRARADRLTGLRTATFVSGYEGSPLAGYDLELARQRHLAAEADIVHRPGLNEELAATSVMGSQLAGEVGELRPDGVVGIWYGKSPGLDRASDALRHANLIGTGPRGGAVALVGDDPGAKSSTVPCASEAALADLGIPTLYPADTQDVLDFGLHAQYLSRFSGVWSALKVATAVADAAGTAVVHPDRVLPVLGEGGLSTHRPSGRLLGANLMALERSLHTVRLPRALEYARNNGLNRIVRSALGDRIGIAASGKTYLDVREALETLGLDEEALSRCGIRLLKIGMIYPVEPEIVTRFADGLDEILVVEEKRAFLETALKEILYGRPGAPSIHGKRAADGRTLFSDVGELDADSVAAGLARALERRELPSVQAWRQRPKPGRIALPLTTRSPYFCSGCPHNSSTKVEEGTLVGGGIGCHAMVLMMEPEQVGSVVGLTQMGGEGSQWIGMAPFVNEGHFVQNIGDGTFLHSGSLSVRAAVAAGVNITFKLLYNSTVAMTGGQDAVGEMPVHRLAALLLEEGAAKVVITTEDRSRIRTGLLPKGVRVTDRRELADVQRELAAVRGVTVLIHDQECAAEKRRKRRRGKIETPATKVMINERVCEGCGDCGAKSNCLSVHPTSTEFGRKTAIHQSSCNVDYSCLEGDCPSFVTVVPGKARDREPVPDLAVDDLPAPAATTLEPAGFGMRITGVGGTGVVTVTQILATAAVIEGRHVRTLDQTGLAQKGGAVVSDLKITADPLDQAAKLAESTCDLYLGCDSLVATDPGNLKAASARRTVGVVSTTEIPTGRMVVDTAAAFPAQGEIRSAVDGACKQAFYLDAGMLAKELLGDEQYANMVLVGAALQTGALPVSGDAVEQAITLNGTAVPANIQALRRGRQAIADPDALRDALERRRPEQVQTPDSRVEALAGIVGAAADSALGESLRTRVADLVGYQNERYARTYADFVEQVRLAESVAVPGSTLLTEAVARYLHKLMAYKDEYEVARLSLDPSFERELEVQFGEGSRYAYRLHPPVLRALGMKKKIALGAWFRPVFRVLLAMRRLRGTPLDVFGYAEVRRVERRLIGEYRDAVTEAAARLRPENLATAVRLAELPDAVRGYEGIKLTSVESYRRELSTVRSELDAVMAQR